MKYSEHLPGEFKDWNAFYDYAKSNANPENGDLYVVDSIQQDLPAPELGFLKPGYAKVEEVKYSIRFIADKAIDELRLRAEPVLTKENLGIIIDLMERGANTYMPVATVNELVKETLKKVHKIYIRTRNEQIAS